MAPKGVKRALSKAGSSVAKKCKVIASTIRNAQDVPQPVRSMLCDTLVRTFGTYKEERHPLQNNASALIASILKSTQDKLQMAIKEALEKKAVVDTLAATLSAENDAAMAAFEAASQALADSKTAVANSKAAMKDAKTAVHDLEAEGKSAEAEAAAATAKKQKIEALLNDFIPGIKQGTRQGAAAGKHVGKDIGDSVDEEFSACVTRTFCKPCSSWGTFDTIVDQRLDESLKATISGLTSELAAMAAATDARASNVETAKAGIVSAEEQVQAIEAACANATTAAKDADVAAKAASTSFKQQQQQVQKAAAVCTNAENASTTFTNGALAAYTEVESRAAPPPEPEDVAPLAAAAMAPAPAPEAQPKPTVGQSPGVMSMVSQGVRNLLPSPRVASTPPVQVQSPGRA